MLFFLLFLCSRISLRAEKIGVPTFRFSGVKTTAFPKLHTDYEYFKVYPNPAEELLTVEISMKLPAHISITMLNSTGEIIRVLAKDLFPSGKHILETTLNNVPAGTYAIRYEKGDKVQIRKVVIK
ncbi:T9SS type A sorting domain-containing protein [Runella slithyformis]|uniref:T9SS type A sorting domain-containing protein n=1 Tax=Runella slithyformis TaxID=106 RepID=UPI0021D266BF|nr:T9SS type A sorting domain-containing protein [Runella slithyformis]